MDLSLTIIDQKFKGGEKKKGKERTAKGNSKDRQFNSCPAHIDQKFNEGQRTVCGHSPTVKLPLSKVVGCIQIAQNLKFQLLKLFEH